MSLLGAPVWITGTDGTIVYVNERAEKLLGRTSAECLNRPCHSTISGKKNNGASFCGPDCLVHRLADLGKEIEPIPMRLPVGGGKEKFVRVVVIVSESSAAGGQQLIHCVVDGSRDRRLRQYLSTVVNRSPGGRRVVLDDYGLTQREKEILALLAADETLHGIAETLCVSYATVRNHVQHILGKLNVHSILEAVALYLLVDDR